MPKKIVPVSASNDGVLQTELVAGPEIKGVAAEAVVDRDRRLQGLGLRADVVFPDDRARFGLERGHETPAGVALVKGRRRDHLFERAAGDDQLAAGHERAGEEYVDRMQRRGIRALARSASIAPLR